MASLFPSSLDSFTNPVEGDNLDSPDHASLHSDVNDAVEALEIKVGRDSSPDSTSLDNIVRVSIPIGAIMMRGQASIAGSIGGKWFLCDGQAISRTTYSDLYSLIGTTFGAGDGSTTFNVPDIGAGRPVASQILSQIDDNLDTSKSNNDSANESLWASLTMTYTTNNANPFSVYHSHTYFRPNSGKNSNTGSSTFSHTHTISTSGGSKTRDALSFGFYILALRG